MQETDAYREGASLAEDMAAFELPSGCAYETVEVGGKIFSDRTQHVWDGFTAQAFMGMTYLSKGVSATAQVTASESGYLLMIARSDRTVSEDWTLLAENLSNPGVDVTQAFHCYVAYVEAGSAIDVIADGILLTNAAMQ